MKTGHCLTGFFHFFFIILAFSLSRLWRHTFLAVSPPLSARWRLVASFPLPSALACPMKIEVVPKKQQIKE